jgi:hypothetical protein
MAWRSLNRTSFKASPQLAMGNYLLSAGLSPELTAFPDEIREALSIGRVFRPEPFPVGVIPRLPDSLGLRRLSALAVGRVVAFSADQVEGSASHMERVVVQ